MKLKGILLIALLLAFPAYAADTTSTGDGETKTLIWPDGTRYVGGVKDGKRSGKGTIYWQDGTRFVGNFSDDLRNGPGTMILPDGTVYNGYFRDDKLIEAPAEPAAPEVAISEPDPMRPAVVESRPAAMEPEPAPEPVVETPVVETAVVDTPVVEVAVATEAAPTEPPAVMPPPEQPYIPGELPITEVNGEVKDALISAVDGWAAAWSDQNVDGYLAAYSEDFDVPGQQSRGAWEGLRRSRLRRPSYINVEVVYEQFEIVEPNVAQVSFKQTYRSDVYSDETDKVLRLRKEGDAWRILREFSR